MQSTDMIQEYLRRPTLRMPSVLDAAETRRRRMAAKTGFIAYFKWAITMVTAIIDEVKNCKVYYI